MSASAIRTSSLIISSCYGAMYMNSRGILSRRELVRLRAADHSRTGALDRASAKEQRNAMKDVWAAGRIVRYSDKGGCGADASRRTAPEETSDICP
jgi:hypothetical protein